MGLPHFFAGAPEPGAAVRLTTEDARHAIRSLRLTPGDRLTTSDGDGAVAVCRVVRAARDRLEAEVEERTVEARPEPVVRMILAPPKGDRLAWAVQKLTEVGIDTIVLAEASRSVRRWAGDRARRAVDRIAAVSREAAKQARRRFLPEVRGPVAWNEALEEALGLGPTVVLWEEAIDALSGLLPDATAAVTLAVGPEGGIPEEDAHAARDRGAVLASLGPTVLRVETAALVGAALALDRYGRLGT